MSEPMNQLQQLYIPKLKQLGVETLHRDGSRCHAVFDRSVCTGDLIAVEADEGCLITRYSMRMERDLELDETFHRSLCIMSYSPNCAYGMPVHEPDEDAGDARIVSVFIQPSYARKRRLRAGGLYEATRITYMPSYFDAIDLPFVGDFNQIASVIPNPDDELLSLNLRGLLEDLDLGAAQKPSGMYYYRSKALQALCHVMDMASELRALSTSGMDAEALGFVRRVMEIVESSLDNTPSIREISSALYVGHTYLCETFKNATGLTVGEYARKRKVESAKVLLRDPSLPIKEIARRMGFKTTGGFAASFKQLTGLTPRQYRMSRAVNPRAM